MRSFRSAASVWVGMVALCLIEWVRAAEPPVWIDVRAGEYALGEKDHAINPPRVVRLAAYRIAPLETTNAQFAVFVRSTGYRTDAERRGYGLVFREGMIDWEWERAEGASWRDPNNEGIDAAKDLPSHPVTQVSWSDAMAYCHWAKVRLPTLDEWEVAARAGSKKRYPWGGDFVADRANIWNGETHKKNTCRDGWLTTSPVGTYPPNAWGFYDVIGNVFEYCAGLPKGRSGNAIAARGGSWWCSAGTCSFFNLVDIGEMTPHASFSNQGFRVADLP